MTTFDHDFFKDKEGLDFTTWAVGTDGCMTPDKDWPRRWNKLHPHLHHISDSDGIHDSLVIMMKFYKRHLKKNNE